MLSASSLRKWETGSVFSVAPSTGFTVAAPAPTQRLELFYLRSSEAEARAEVRTPKEYSLARHKRGGKTPLGNAIVTGMIGMPQLITDNPILYDQEQQKTAETNMMGPDRKIRRVYDVNRQVIAEYTEGEEIHVIKL